MVSWKKTTNTLILSLLVAIGSTSVALAAQYSSPHYQVNEVFFGSGGDLQDCSTNYCAKTSAGETAVGNVKSSNYQAQAGFNTDRMPSLTFVVNTSSIDLGVLAVGTPKTATATFSVKTYLASGYVVTNASPPPKNGSYTINTLTTPTASAPGTEQFGINLVNNTTACGAPANYGADPAQVPSSTFSFGTAASGYNTCGKYKYVNGDTIASSNKSSGETDYTISYLFNISPVTPSGAYTFDHVLVATSTF